MAPAAGSKAPQALVGNVVPELAADHERVPPLAVVARGDEPAPALPPRSHDAVDGCGGEVGPVGEDDDSRLHVGSERTERATQRGARPQLPVRAGNDAYALGLERVGARRDHDVVHGRLPQPLEHCRQEQPLLRRPEPRRRPGGEHHGRHLSARATPWGLTPGHVRRGRRAAHRATRGFRVPGRVPGEGHVPFGHGRGLTPDMAPGDGFEGTADERAGDLELVGGARKGRGRVEV